MLFDYTFDSAVKRFNAFIDEFIFEIQKNSIRSNTVLKNSNQFIKGSQETGDTQIYLCQARQSTLLFSIVNRLYLFKVLNFLSGLNSIVTFTRHGRAKMNEVKKSEGEGGERRVG